jgi:Skp family chaperone for outer membrane proteins
MTMTRTLAMVLSAFWVCALAFTGLVHAQGGAIGVVNMAKFAEKSHKFTAMQKKLQELAVKKQAEFEEKKEKLLAMQEDLKKQGPMLKEDTQNARIKEIGIKEMELKLFEKQAQTQMQNEQRESMEVFRRDIGAIASQVRKQKNLQLIMMSDMLMSYDNALDITEEVAKLYDSQPGAEAPKAAAPAPAAPAKAPAAGPAKAPAPKPAAPAPPK